MKIVISNCVTLFLHVIILSILFNPTAFAETGNSPHGLNFQPPFRHFSKEVLYGRSIPNQSAPADISSDIYRNSLSPAATIAQPFIASAIGLATAFISGYAGGIFASRIAERNSTHWGFTGLIYGGYVGYIVGSAVGCWQFGKIKNVDGSFEGTLMGSLIGGFAGIGWASSTEDWGPLLLGAPIGATITFHLTREP